MCVCEHLLHYRSLSCSLGCKNIHIGIIRTVVAIWIWILVISWCVLFFLGFFNVFQGFILRMQWIVEIPVFVFKKIKIWSGLFLLIESSGELSDFLSQTTFNRLKYLLCIYTYIYIYIYTHTQTVPSPLSHLRLLATPWMVAYEAPLSIGFSRQEYWRGLPWPPPGDLPDSGIEPESLSRQILYHCTICTYTNSSSWQWKYEGKIL